MTWISLILTVAGSAFSILFAVFGLGWKISGWLTSMHAQRVISFQKLDHDFNAMFVRHEKRDNERHIENIGRFAEINERLARMGNGRR